MKRLIHDFKVKKYFADGAALVEQHLPKGYEVFTEAHQTDRLSVLAKGRCKLDGVEMVAPAVEFIKKGRSYKIETLEDIVWYCVRTTEREGSGMEGI